MNKFQPVKFHSIEDFLGFLPEEELNLVEYLRSIVKSCMPFCKEKLSLNVPFYYIHKRILFIWPSAVPWGNVDKGGVSLGFCNGYLIPDEIGYLNKGTRKQVYTKTFFRIEDIDVDLLKAYIYTAIEIDDVGESSKGKPKGIN